MFGSLMTRILPRLHLEHIEVLSPGLTKVQLVLQLLKSGICAVSFATEFASRRDALVDWILTAKVKFEAVVVPFIPSESPVGKVALTSWLFNFTNSMVMLSA